jgi:hypothetical protein
MKVLPFRRPAPRPPQPILRPGAEVYLSGSEADGWLIIDMSPSGGSAGTHGTFATRAEAMFEGRRVAYLLGATFLDDEEGA